MRMMAGRMVEAVIFALLCGIAMRGVLGGSDCPPPKLKTLVYYVSESFVGPNTTVVVIAGQNNNLTFVGFGQTVSFDNPITLTDNTSDMVVGRAVGFGSTANEPNVNHFTSTQYFNTTALGVGSVEVAGKLDTNYPYKASEVVVSGGTGAFKFLRGVATIYPVYFNFPYHTFKVTVSLV